jgi:hypothetical protein
MTPPALDLNKPTIEVVEYISSGTRPLVTEPVLPSPTEELVGAAVRVPSVATTSITSGHYSRLIESIRALILEDEEDRPTDFASAFAFEVLAGAAERLAMDFPAACVTVGPAGSLRISWTDGGRHVRLICGGSAQNKTYIYFEDKQRHGAIEKFDADNLASILGWMMLS